MDAGPCGRKRATKLTFCVKADLPVSSKYGWYTGGCSVHEEETDQASFFKHSEAVP